MHDWFDMTRIAKHVTPTALWMHGVTDDFTWLIFTVLFFGTCCTKKQTLIPIISLIHEGFASDIHLEEWPRFKQPQRLSTFYFQSNFFPLRGHSVRSTIWQQIVQSASQDAQWVQLSIAHFLYSDWPPYAPILICPSRMVHLLSEHWLHMGVCSLQHKETTPQWDNYADNGCGKIVFLNLIAVTILMFGIDCILFTKNQDWWLLTLCANIRNPEQR